MFEPPRSDRGERMRPPHWRVRAVIRVAAEALLSLADHLVPKRSDRIVIGSDGGRSLNGNALHLFLYLVRSGRGEVRVVTRSPIVKREIEALRPGAVLDDRSWRAVWFGLTAASLCMTHTRADLGLLRYLRGPRFVYLTHGIPLKAMGYQKTYRDPFIRRQRSSFRAITCCSEPEATRWRMAYRLEHHRTWVTGTPRNDALFSPQASVSAELAIDGSGPVVLYAPTFRETGVMGSYLPTPDLDAEDLVTLLERFDATLLVRAHPMDAAAAVQHIDRIGSPRIRTADHALIDNVNDLLPWIDILVSDYSSIYLDYLLLDRPIIFSCHDLEEYEQDRGLSLDYMSHTPGQHVRDGKAFLVALEIELEGADPAAEERARIRSLFHTHTDAGSAARVADRLLGAGSVEP